MIDSTARAERFDPAPSISPYYTWEVAQKPVLVRLPLVLIDRLEREAVESFRSVSSRGSEIGGVLWGSVEPGDPAALSVVEYDLIACDYTLGPLYRLSESDLARLDRVLGQGGSGLRPVGFFRSHTRKGLALDADDLALMESRFPEPHQVALVIRPYASKASTAGIFLRENGAIHGESSYLEFPFRSAQLAPAKHLADVVDPAANPPVPPVAPKPVVRAQIVPIASRRDISAAVPPLAAEPVPAPAPQAPQPIPQPLAQPLAQAIPSPLPQPVAQPLPQPMAQPLPQPVVQPLPQPVQPLPQPVVQPVVQAASQPDTPPPGQSSAAPAVEPPEPAPATETAAAPEAEKTVEPEAAAEDAVAASVAEPARTRGMTKAIWFGVGAIFPLLLSGILFIYPGVLRRTNLPGAISGQDTSPLALRVERSGSELLLTWNNDSSAIRNATRAVLSISDGEQHENVEMDLAQLRNGRIEYLPVTGDVVFRMEVSGKDNAKTVSESVRVLRTRPSPMSPDSDSPAGQNPISQAAPSGSANAPPAEASANTAAPNGQGGPSAATPAPGAPSTDPASGAASQASTPSAPVRPFNTASLSDRLRPVRSDDIALPDAPAVGRESLPASDTALRLTAVSPTGLTAPRKGDPPAAPPKQAALASGGDVQQAQLIYRKTPEYPSLARSAGAKGTVELVATIGANGRVKSVKVTKGHPLLQKAAVDAVMQWQYKPTMLNGHPVETETTITLNFLNDR